MPAYDQPIKFNLGPAPKVERFAAVIEFDSLDKERIQHYLDRLYAQGIISQQAHVRAYNPNMTSPELYFP